jgi:hypothetical protein
MNKKIPLCAALLALALPQSHGQVAFDDASSPAYTDSWSQGDNGGFGFAPWLFNNTQGTGSAGVFIGDPAAAEITGMDTSSFGFFANPLDSGANAEVSRSLLAPLEVGQTFSFQWGLNWDSNSSLSNRGFNLFSGATQILNINMGNSATITIDGSDPAPAQTMFSEFGTQGFVLNFEQLSPTVVRVFGTGRNGSETFDSNFTVAGLVTGFSFYFNATEGINQRQMYVNDLQVVPEPQTLGMLALGALGLFVIRLRARARAK